MLLKTINKQSFLGLKSAVFKSVCLDGKRIGGINNFFPTCSCLFFYELVLVHQLVHDFMELRLSLLCEPTSSSREILSNHAKIQICSILTRKAYKEPFIKVFCRTWGTMISGPHLPHRGGNVSSCSQKSDLG